MPRKLRCEAQREDHWDRIGADYTVIVLYNEHIVYFAHGHNAIFYITYA